MRECFITALGDGVKITDQRVPGAVLNGTDYVVLDCLYKVKPDETKGLVVTWYFNSSPSPAYQWIQGQPPRTIGPLRSRINLGYAAPTDDELSKYRALYIIRPTIELSGDYKCVVSTYTDEDFMIKKMTVYGESDSCCIAMYIAQILVRVSHSRNLVQEYYSN